MLRIFKHEDREVEEHFLRLGRRDAMRHPVLLGIAGIPLEAPEGVDQFTEIAHRGSIWWSYTSRKRRHRTDSDVPNVPVQPRAILLSSTQPNDVAAPVCCNAR